MHEFLQLEQVRIYPEHWIFYPTKIDPKMIHHLIQFALKYENGENEFNEENKFT
jgi:hypothetical protein